MESLLKTLWRRLRFYLIDWGLIARRGIFYIGGKLRLKLLESRLVQTVTLKQNECRKRNKK